MEIDAWQEVAIATCSQLEHLLHKNQYKYVFISHGFVLMWRMCGYNVWMFLVYSNVLLQAFISGAVFVYLFYRSVYTICIDVSPKTAKEIIEGEIGKIRTVKKSLANACSYGDVLMPVHQAELPGRQLLSQAVTRYQCVLSQEAPQSYAMIPTWILPFFS